MIFDWNNTYADAYIYSNNDNIYNIHEKRRPVPLRNYFLFRPITAAINDDDKTKPAQN